MNFPKKLLIKIENSPNLPGCYIYKDINKNILYIGKAINIKNRTKSYFKNYKILDPKISVMVKQINDVEFVTTDSELEALILETNLIKKYKPKYNRLMKDDKNYAWLMITKSDDFPRLEIIRNKKNTKADYFGPYVNIKPIKRALKSLRKIFPYRSCKRKIKLEKKVKKLIFYSSNKKPCLYYYLNLCNAPCNNKVSKNNYRKNINNIKRFFRSRKFQIIKELKKEMQQYSKNKKYEEASMIRDKLEDLTYIAQRIKVEQDMDEKLWKIKKDLNRIESTKKLISKLKFKKLKYKKSFRIECYDISNISGKNATGSMVVFVDGKNKKKHYRKFKIKTKNEPDDFLMLKEVFKRRFKMKNSDRSFRIISDLIIVDGGKGQLSSVIEILNNYKLKIPTIGLAKKEEEIFKLVNDKFEKIKLKKGSNELFLIQRIRDEAHRFAIKYHRLLRNKSQIKSVLNDIPGVGDTIRKKLLKAFGSSENIKKASVKELQAIVKNINTVKNIKKFL